MPDEVVTTIPGADGGAAAAVAEPVVEEPIVPGAEGAPEITEPADGEQPKPEGEEEDLGVETDGRKMDLKTRQEIAELKKTNPVAAKKWAESYFRNQAVMKEFPEAKNIGEVIAQIREAKVTLDSVGGQKGLDELQGEVTDYRSEIEQFSKGDPALLAQLYEANPEQTIIATQNALELIKGKNAESYLQAITPTLATIYETHGLNSTVDQLLALVKEGKGQESYDRLIEVKKYLDTYKDAAKHRVEATAKKDPQAEANAAERQRLDQEKSDIYKERVTTDVNKIVDEAANKQIASLVKDLKLTPAGRAHFMNGLKSRIWNVMAKDQIYLRNAKNIRAKGNPSEHAKFVAGKFNELLPEQFKLHRNEIYPNWKPAAPAKKTENANGTGKSAVTVSSADGRRPKREDVDWTKTDQLNMITGKGVVLKNGKIVNFDPKVS